MACDLQPARGPLARTVLAGVGWVTRLLLRSCRGHAAEMERGVAAAAAERAQAVDYGLRIVAQEQVGLAYAGWDRWADRVAPPAWRMGRWPARLDAGVVAALTELSRRDRLAEGFASRLGERPACDLLEEPGSVDEAASLLAARLFHWRPRGARARLGAGGLAGVSGPGRRPHLAHRSGPAAPGAGRAGRPSPHGSDPARPGWSDAGTRARPSDRACHTGHGRRRPLRRSARGVRGERYGRETKDGQRQRQGQGQGQGQGQRSRSRSRRRSGRTASPCSGVSERRPSRPGSARERPVRRRRRRPFRVRAGAGCGAAGPRLVVLGRRGAAALSAPAAAQWA